MKQKLTVLTFISLAAALLLITTGKLKKQFKIAHNGELQNSNIELTEEQSKEINLSNITPINIIGQITDNAFKAFWEDNVREMKSLNPQLYKYRFSINPEIQNSNLIIKKSLPSKDLFNSPTLTTPEQLKADKEANIVRNDIYCIKPENIIALFNSALYNKKDYYYSAVCNNLNKDNVFSTST